MMSRIRCLHLVWLASCKTFKLYSLNPQWFRDLGASFLSLGHFRVLVASFSSLGCSVSEFWVLRFRDLGASFSRFGCFVLRSSFSSSSFSKLPVIMKRVLFCEIQQMIFCIRDAWWVLHGRITRCSCVSGHVVRAKAVRLSLQSRKYFT